MDNGNKSESTKTERLLATYKDKINGEVKQIPTSDADAVPHLFWFSASPPSNLKVWFEGMNNKHFAPAQKVEGSGSKYGFWFKSWVSI